MVQNFILCCMTPKARYTDLNISKFTKYLSLDNTELAIYNLEVRRR